MTRIKAAVSKRIVKDFWKKLSFWLLAISTSLEGYVWAISKLSEDPTWTQWIPSGWQTWAFPVILFARVFTFMKPKDAK